MEFEILREFEFENKIVKYMFNEGILFLDVTTLIENIFGKDSIISAELELERFPFSDLVDFTNEELELLARSSYEKLKNDETGGFSFAMTTVYITFKNKKKIGFSATECGWINKVSN